MERKTENTTNNQLAYRNRLRFYFIGDKLPDGFRESGPAVL
jgi:hypothetical protein